MRAKDLAKLAALASAFLIAQAAHASQFDGRWDVVLTTTAGDC